MVTWKLLSDKDAHRTWDQNLIRFNDFSPFQMYSWGEYNRTLGWQALYWSAEDETGEVVAMMMGLLRRYPFSVGLLWCAGGPIGDVRFWDENLQQTLLETTKIKRLYCRFRCDRPRNIDEALALNHQNWMRSWFMLHSSWTMEFDLKRETSEMLSSLSRNWRRNLKSSQKNNIRISLWESPDIAEIASVYEEMQARKDLPEQFSREQLKNLFERVGSNFICFRAEDEAGELVAFRGCLIVGDRAVDHLAATTKRGRDLYASYAVLWQLLEECRNRNIQFYDLSGIDPYQNPGVYNFKKTTGARPVESLGEWDWASSNWLRWFGNWAMWQKYRLETR